jgi:regulator of protease activity HflC (stomatin/prohibitin superfamily)
LVQILPPLPKKLRGSAFGAAPFCVFGHPFQSLCPYALATSFDSFTSYFFASVRSKYPCHFFSGSLWKEEQLRSKDITAKITEAFGMGSLFSAWLIWFIIGIVLAFLELFLPGFVIIFMGVGCLVVAGALLIWTLTVPQQIALFIAATLLSIIFLRKWFMKIFHGFSSGHPEIHFDDFPKGEHVRVVKRISPQASGRIMFRGTLWDAVSDQAIAGFHLLFPFLDRVAYKYSLKEEVIDIPSQTCITKDNVTVEVDGLIYPQVMDSKLAAYGINDYRMASSQLAQTTLRSCIGKIDLDKTFEERQATINRAEGDRQDAILRSEGEKQRRINEAEGRAKEILAIAQATAEGLNLIAEQLQADGGTAAANLRVAEQYVTEFGKLAKTSNTLIIPNNVGDLTGMVATALSTFKKMNPASA